MVRRVRPDGHDRLAVPRAAAPARPAAGSPTEQTRRGRRRARSSAPPSLRSAWSLVDLAAAAADRRWPQRGDRRGASHLPLAVAGWRAGVRPRLDVGADHHGRARSSSTPSPALQRAPGNYLAALSERHDRHVYAGGLRLRPGFLTTVGNVDQRRRPDAAPRTSSTMHEHVHVWQARWFGPLYPLIYGVWTSLGSAVGAVVWVARAGGSGCGKVVDTMRLLLQPVRVVGVQPGGPVAAAGGDRRATWTVPIRVSRRRN